MEKGWRLERKRLRGEDVTEDEIYSDKQPRVLGGGKEGKADWREEWRRGEKIVDGDIC